MRVNGIVAIVAFILLCAGPAPAWWDEGHILVAKIAWEQSSPSTRAFVEKILRAHPDPEVQTLEDAAVWPDKVRDREHPFHNYHHSDWHYQNRPFESSERPMEESGHLLEQLQKHSKILKDSTRPMADRAVSLSWVAHLVGDIHQPLHNSNYVSEVFPEGDEGGNQFIVILGDRPISLHKLWDSAGGRFLVPSSVERIQSYARWFTDAHPSDSFAEELSRNGFRSWSDECLRLAEQVSYSGIEHEQPLQEPALRAALDTTRRQITLAGYRLANLLVSGNGE